MPLTTVLIMVDGLDPRYLESCPALRIRELAERGFMVDAKAMMPTVTNVNNVSLVTASYPQTHGITTNYWFDRRSSEEFYMESGEFIKAETMFQRAGDLGARSLLVTAKDKLRRLLGDGATLSVSSEQPPGWVVRGVGEPPPIYSLEVNQWVIDAGRYILSKEHYDLVYLTTTDYAMHTYAPEQPESSRHLAMLDEAIGKLLDSLPEFQVLITADHGMSPKSRMIHLPAELARNGIRAQAIPIIKDRYTVHHSNLGGCIYVYLEDGEVETALEALNRIDGVDEALSREVAAERFRLMAGRIGDIMVMGSAEVVFGDPKEVDLPGGLRSHGSLYEQRVPVIGYGGAFDGFEFNENKDLGRYVFERVLV
ncbi:MAG: alkaline phosphatase family protein [Dehalococcoidia bacterium]|nr:alkaline phosphatase family protein [Dehalococcoidia bacterium]